MTIGNMRSPLNIGDNIYPLIGRIHETLWMFRNICIEKNDIDIVGPRGSGKSALILSFLQHQSHHFPGGVCKLLPIHIHHFGDQTDDTIKYFLEHLSDQLDMGKKRKLIVLDSAENISTSLLSRLVEEAKNQFKSVSIIVSGTVGHGISRHILNLRGLSNEEAIRLIKSNAGYSADRAAVDYLIEATHGNPRWLRIIFDPTNPHFEIDRVVELFTPEKRQKVRFAINEIRKSITSPARNALITEVRAVTSYLLDIVQNNPNFILSMTPRNFEEFIAELFHKKGYGVLLTPQTRDGGKDMYLTKKTDFGVNLYLAECKHYAPHRPVDVGVVRELNGVMDVEGATGALIITTSYYTRAAQDFQKKIEHRMSLTDLAHISAWIEDAVKL